MSEHLVYIKGVEIVYHEFKELLLELALRLKDQVDSAPGKLRSLIKKFLDDHFLKRLGPYIKFSKNKEVEVADTQPKAASAARSWPESKKDQAIREVMEEKRKREAEEQRLKEEERQRQAELAAQEQADQADQEALQASEEPNAAAEEEAKKKETDNDAGSNAEEDDDDDEDAEGDSFEDEDSDY